MKIAAVQYAPRCGERDSVLDRIARVAGEMRPGLIVLPELAFSDYLFEERTRLLDASEPVPDGDTCRALAALARGHGCAIAAGMAERSGDDVCSSVAMFGTQGFLGVYRKQHLTALEAPLFSRGTRSFTADLPGGRVGVVVCFDAWFPETCRALIRAGAQIIICPANFGGPQSLTIAAARAIENGVPFVLANRTGRERRGEREVAFRGESRIIRPDGALAAKAGAEEAVIVCDVELKPPEDVALLGVNRDVELSRTAPPAVVSKATGDAP